MRTRVQDLAILTGIPAFTEPLHVGRPNIGDQERLFERFREIFSRRYFTNNGPHVREFESRIAEYVGVKHCIAMCNATIALEIAMRSLGMTGEVIVPSLTFIATAHALQWQGVTPVFADIAAATRSKGMRSRSNQGRRQVFRPTVGRRPALRSLSAATTLTSHEPSTLDWD